MKTTIILIAWLLPIVVFAQYQPHAIWSREGAGDSSLYGSSILALGDQNDDGYNDWAVYAAGLGYAPAGSPNEPRVEFFHGGNPPDTVPYMVRVADRATEISVRGAKALGDLNGDGYVDWYIFTGYVGDTTGRHIYKIYFGGPGSHEVPDLVVTSPWFSTYDGIGDFNGDHFDDLLYADGVNNRAYVLHGGNPMDTLPDWSRSPILIAVGKGDVNYDGYSDFISDTGPVVGPQVFLGRANPDTNPAYNFPSLHSGATSILRDMNGDNFDDLCFDRSGRGQICCGGNSLDTVTCAHLTFPCSGSGPQSIVSAGDFNHDGFGDIVMLHQWCENDYFGVLTLHLGGWWINSESAFVIYGWTEPLNLLHFKCAANLGDINGDQIDDLAIGANDAFEAMAWRGKAVILGGDDSLIADAPDPHAPVVDQLKVVVYPNPFNSSTTVKLTLPVCSRDVVLTLFNLLGQEVFRAPLAVRNEEMSYSLDANSFPTGLYLLRVASGNLSATKKLMVLK